MRRCCLFIQSSLVGVAISCQQPLAARIVVVTNQLRTKARFQRVTTHSTLMKFQIRVRLGMLYETCQLLAVIGEIGERL